MRKPVFLTLMAAMAMPVGLTAAATPAAAQSWQDRRDIREYQRDRYRDERAARRDARRDWRAYQRGDINYGQYRREQAHNARDYYRERREDRRDLRRDLRDNRPWW